MQRREVFKRKNRRPKNGVCATRTLNEPQTQRRGLPYLGGWRPQKQKRPITRWGALAFHIRRKRSEGDFYPEMDLPLAYSRWPIERPCRSRGLRGEGEPRRLSSGKAGVIHEGVDADEVGMVPQVDERYIGVDVKPLSNLHVPEELEVGGVRMVVPQGVPADVAVRCAIHRIRERSIGDKAHLVGVNGRCRSAGVDGVEAEQGVVGH